MREVEEIDLYEDADFADLRDGRDFLGEKMTYNVVILHFVWNNKRQTDTREIEAHPSLTVSYRNTPKNWRDRLAASNATYIFAYGGGEEVTGYYIGDVPGYTMVLRAGSPYADECTIYTKIDQQKEM